MITKVKGNKKKNLAFVITLIVILQMIFIHVPALVATAATYLRIKNVWQQTYLYEDDSQVMYGNLSADDQRSHWELLDAGDGSVRIRNRASGEYINIEHLYNYAECTPIGMDWYSSRWFIDNTDDNHKYIRNSWQPANYIHIENLQGYAQQGNIDMGWQSARWDFEAVDSGITPTPEPPTPTPTTTPTGQPDLTITDIQWSPEAPQAGEEVTFQAVVKNQGTGISADGVINGVAFRVNDTVVSWSDTNTTPIQPGESVTLTSNWGPNNKATWTAANGTFTVNAWVDDVYRISESDENNNMRNETLTISENSTPTPEPPTPTPVKPTPDPTPIPTDPPSPSEGIEASSTEYIYYAENAIDGDLNTYWEGAGGTYPNTLMLRMGADVNVTSIVLKLNPSSAWATRTQNIQVLGRDQNSTTFVNLASATDYTFNPATGNSVTIPVTAKVNVIQLKFNSNTGAGGGQVAEFIVNGTPAPNPDLTITGITYSPTSPIETDAITLNATVQNIGTATVGASNVKFYLDTTLVGTVSTPTLDADGSLNVSCDIGQQNAGNYALTAIVDEANSIIELNNSNNSYTSANSLIVNEVPSSDLVGTVTWAPSNPSAGNAVTFTVNLKNQGNIATATGTHDVTVVLKNSSGATVRTFQNSYSGVLSAGASTLLTMGTWTAADGSYSVTCTVAADANEVAIKQSNNIITTSLYSGRGANMPFTVLEAEDTSNSTNGTRLSKNFIPGDYAGEASGRSAVYLDAVGEYVEFTLSAPANAFVLRNAVAENTTGTISLYVNNTDVGEFNVTSKFSYLYATPTTLGRLGYDNSGTKAYWLYEDAQLLLDQVYPAGTKIKIQKNSEDVPWIYVDMIETENVAPAATNPDPSRYVEVSASKSIEQALTEFRQDTTKAGIFIPAGTWEITNKIFLYGRAVEIIGAGPWHTKLTAPQSSSNNDVGFNISSTANGSTLKDFSAWGNYIYRQDGPGKFIDGNGMQNVTVENIWAEHFICLYWGVNASNNTFRDCRIKNTFADGINMTNGSSYNVITNCYARGCGDDAFALFSAADAGGSYNVGNLYSNLTAVCTRRAASFAVYGGSDNTYTNLYGADTLTYPGITISSYSFGYNTLGFGDVDCVFDGVTLDRCGGDFWTSNGADDKINDYQNFGAIWIYSGDRVMQNILVKNVDINEPVYFGLMFQSMYPNPIPMDNIRFENININNAPRYGIKFVVKAEDGQGPCVGEASFTNVKINNAGIMPVYGLDRCPNFTVYKIGSDNNW